MLKVIFHNCESCLDCYITISLILNQTDDPLRPEVTMFYIVKVPLNIWESHYVKRH